MLSPKQIELAEISEVKRLILEYISYHGQGGDYPNVNLEELNHFFRKIPEFTQAYEDLIHSNRLGELTLVARL